MAMSMFDDQAATVTVRYHGSLTEAHGVYIAERDLTSRHPGRLRLTPVRYGTDTSTGGVLLNVRPASCELIQVELDRTVGIEDAITAGRA